jgi:hypothetical protein
VIDPEAAVREVQAVRRVARSIARDERLGRQRLVLLAALVELVRRKALLPSWAQLALWIEAAPLVIGGQTPAPPTTGGDPIERACRFLLRQGFARCPSCSRPLPDDAQLERWRDLRRDAVAEALAGEAAC